MQIDSDVARGHAVDASVLGATLVDSGAVGLWSEQFLANCFLVAPQLVIAEALNILCRLEHAGQLTALEASSAQQDLHDLEIQLFPIRPFEGRIWELRHNLSCYDAWYVAVAEAFGLPLATLDKRLARAADPRCSFRTPE